MSRFDRISIDPERMGGVPCVRNLRIPVATIVGRVGEGQTCEQILADYPDLSKADIRQALEFATELPIHTSS